MRQIALILAVGLVGLLMPAAASAAPGFKLGLFDDSQTFGNTSEAFANYGALGVDVLRITMHWNDVAPTRPVNPADPADPAYRWSEYDRVAIQAAERGIGLVVTIMGAPPWANGGKSPAVVPSKARGLRKFSRQLKKFARAAARRYSGAETAKYAALPVIDKWVAWNEPNLRNFLKPQYIRVKSKGGKRKFVRRSPVLYASICKAIYRGVHQSGRELGVDEQVACGVTAPGGNNNPRSSRPSISPILFLRDLKRSGAKFDAYAHHPYPGSPLETPADRPTVRTRITLGSIWRLLRELEDLYSADIPLWITEYGYQTNPPDTIFGVSRKKQAKYLDNAAAIVLANPRIEMMIWFLLRDEELPPSGGTGGWQSGLLTADGNKKRSFKTFAGVSR